MKPRTHFGSGRYRSTVTPLKHERRCFSPLTSLGDIMDQFDKKGKRRGDGNLNYRSSSSGIDGIEAVDRMASAKILMLVNECLLHLDSVSDEAIQSLVEAQLATDSDVSIDVAIVLLLQAAAAKVANQQYVSARKFLTMCKPFASNTGSSPLRRLVHYFSGALLEKIDRDCGSAYLSEESGEVETLSLDEIMSRMSLHPEILEAQQANPFSILCQFLAVGAIRDSLASSKRVHLIDFSIGNGSHWTLLLDDFAAQPECPLELLRITAVGTAKEVMEATGKRLSMFAESLGLPFSFNTVVSELKDLKTDHFKLHAKEILAVHASLRFWTLLVSPNYLDALVGTIMSLNPRIMVIKEMEASTNKSDFMKRFDEALIFFSAWFDLCKDCMGNHTEYRKLGEVFADQMIRNIITADGPERIHRFEKLSFWRELFAKFGIEERELSASSLDRARLLIGSSDRFRPLTVDTNGEGLILGWNGTPFVSFSAWKFPYVLRF